MTIAEVSKKYGLSADTLRYYERIGLIPTVTRTAGGIRNYTVDDCAWVEYIKCMRTAGVSVETLIEYISLFRQGNKTLQARKNLLIDQRTQIQAKIEELQATVIKLDAKIDGYEDRMTRCESSLPQ